MWLKKDPSNNSNNNKNNIISGDELFKKLWQRSTQKKKLLNTMLNMKQILS